MDQGDIRALLHEGCIIEGFDVSEQDVVHYWDFLLESDLPLLEKIYTGQQTIPDIDVELFRLIVDLVALEAQ